MSGGRRWCLSLLVVVLTTMACCAAMEGITRLLFPQWAPRSARVSDFWRYDATYGWSHVPNSTGRFESFGFNAAVTHNSRGFRGPVVPYARGGKPRALFLGDSLVWGYGVNDGETLTAVLPGFVPGLEAVNLGVSGYSTDQELLLYRREGYRYGADFVFLVVCGNDFTGNLATTLYLVYGKPAFVEHGGSLDLINEPVAQPSWFRLNTLKLASRSYLASAASRVLESARMRSTVKASNTLARWELTFRLFRMFQESVSERQPGSRFVVVLSDDLGARGTQIVSDFLKQANIECIRLADAVTPRAPRFHLPDGIHWNVTGTRMAAEAIASYMNRNHPRK